ncbi:mCG18160, isoform CRA_c, partial [Mus musculus]
ESSFLQQLTEKRQENNFTLCRKRRPDDNEDDNYRPPRSKRIKKDQDIQEHHAIELS